MTADILRLERKIDRLTKQLQKKPLWVKASVITKITGWNKENMREARMYGYVDFEEREKDGVKTFWYDLNSLSEKFIKH